MPRQLLDHRQPINWLLYCVMQNVKPDQAGVEKPVIHFIDRRYWYPIMMVSIGLFLAETQRRRSSNTAGTARTVKCAGSKCWKVTRTAASRVTFSTLILFIGPRAIPGLCWSRKSGSPAILTLGAAGCNPLYGQPLCSQFRGLVNAGECSLVVGRADAALRRIRGACFRPFVGPACVSEFAGYSAERGADVGAGERESADRCNTDQCCDQPVLDRRNTTFVLEQ